MPSSIKQLHNVKKLNLIASMIAGLAFTPVSHAAGDDPVLASFQRMLDHQAAPAAFCGASSGQADPVQAMVNAALRGGTAAAGDDPVFAGFQRMLDHRAAPVAFYRASSRQADPVQAMLNAGLRSPGSESPDATGRLASLVFDH